MEQQKSETGLSRRKMLGAAAAGTAAFAALGTNFAWSQVSEEMKVGVVGCGGRGSGAAADNLTASGISGVKTKITAVADAFPDRANGLAGKYKVDKSKVFVGLDAYKEMMASDVELVILATPPGFRPVHFEAAVKAGKHIFFEKPVAVDPTGVRRVMAASKLAAEKKLAVVTGTQRRHQSGYMECIKAIHEGAIGDVMQMSVYWNGGGIWWNKPDPNLTPIQNQMRNWYHHIWLCGDQICEQHIHNLDVANWVLQSHPISAYAMGGRQVRDRLGQVGEIWDHFAVEYEYPNGARVLSMCRHWPKATDNVSEFAIGTKGTSNPSGSITTRDGKKMSFGDRKATGPYQQEHVDLLNSIKSGKLLNEGIQVAESTLTAVMGRMSAYTGKKITWDWALNQSKLDLVPDGLTKDSPAPEVKVPQPGETQLI